MDVSDFFPVPPHVPVPCTKSPIELRSLSYGNIDLAPKRMTQKTKGQKEATYTYFVLTSTGLSNLRSSHNL
jgi:hypothetical protein